DADWKVRGLSLRSGFQGAANRPDVELLQHRHDADEHSASADQAVVPAVVVVQQIIQKTGLLLAKKLEGLAPHLGLHAATAEGAHGAIVGTNEHRGACRLRCRAARLDDDAQRGRAAGVVLVDEILKDRKKFTHRTLLYDASRRCSRAAPRRTLL